MDELEKIALEAFEKGKKDTFVPQDPYIAFGFENNPFLHTSLEELRQQIFLQSRIRKVSHYIGKVYSSFTKHLDEKIKKKDSETLDGILFASAQSGTTNLLEITLKLLEKQNNLVYIDAQKFVEFENNQYKIAKSFQNFRNILGEFETDRKNPLLVIIDHADYLISFFEEFRDAFERDFQDSALIFVFTHSGWIRLKSTLSFSNYDLFNKTVQSIEIDPLDNNEIATILKQKLSIDSRIQKPFSEIILNHIASKSGGSILNAIKICNLLCQECFYNGIDIASKKLIDDVSSRLRIDKNLELFDLITVKANSESVIKILALIALKSIAYDIGISYEELTTNLDLQKTSVAHHLKQLEAKGFIEKSKLDRRAFYKLKTELRTISDTYLLSKFEQDVEFARFVDISELM